MKRLKTGLLCGVVGGSLLFAGGVVGKSPVAPTPSEVELLRAEVESLRAEMETLQELGKWIKVKDRPGEKEGGSLVFLCENGETVMLESNGWVVQNNAGNQNRGWLGKRTGK